MKRKTTEMSLKVLELLYDYMGRCRPTLKKEYNSIPKKERKFSYEQFVVAKFSTAIDE